MVELQHTTHITYINITSGDSPYQLQNDLKEQTIDMWEEIESKFNLKRPKKQR